MIYLAIVAFAAGLVFIFLTLQRWLDEAHDDGYHHALDDVFDGLGRDDDGRGVVIRLRNERLDAESN